MARSRMNEKSIDQTYWVEAIHTTFHILNKAHLRPHSDKTLYELWYGRLASIKHYKVFGSKCYIKNNNVLGHIGADPGFNTTTTHQQNPNYQPFREHLRSR
jgi:hypothetical protein